MLRHAALSLFFLQKFELQKFVCSGLTLSAQIQVYAAVSAHVTRPWSHDWSRGINAVPVSPCAPVDTCPAPVAMRTVVFVTALLCAALAKDTFHGHQVLRIQAKDKTQLALIKDLEQLFEDQLDFWRDVSDVSTPVDIRVPPRLWSRSKNT
ncbi:hypothetical protein WMY93_032447 [Mugilogobius chulae]|uniref:Carboxypeptidase activation peptide domain-containing protein n=1 Tax=Mugilogobius chulae TaxID=88201 RepID=A0AAW0MQV6_9GOBI